MINMKKNEAGILRALAFFDVFDFAPTLLELWRWQLETDRIYSVEEVRAAVQNLAGKVITDGVFYSLPGRSLETRIHQRRLRTLHGIRKNKKLFRYVARIARFVPGVRGIAVCNTRLPFLYAENNSDIDLLVITRRGYIWSARFMLVGILKLLRLRPGEVMQDAFDHSMFIADDQLALEHISDINPVYVAAWVASLDPLYGADALWDRFAAENAWVKKYFPAFERFARVPAWRLGGQRTFHLPHKIWFFESLSRAWQSRNFTPVVASKVNTSSAVVAHDGMLKFHTNDKRRAYEENYERVCRELGVL